LGKKGGIVILGARKLVGLGLTSRFCGFTCHYKKIPAEIGDLPAIIKKYLPKL